MAAGGGGAGGGGVVSKAYEADAVVAIDFGTHGTGYTIAVPKGGAGGAAGGAGGGGEGVLDGWEVFSYKVGEGVGRTDKTATALLFDERGEVVAFGSRVRRLFSTFAGDPGIAASGAKRVLYQGFKMMLAPPPDGVETRTLSTVTVTPAGLAPRPVPGTPLPTMTVQALVAAVMRVVKEDALKELERQMHRVPATSRLFWVCTVPAIWSDEGKAVMRSAAYDAGLTATRSAPNFALVLEPECALLATVQELAPEARRRIVAGSNIVMVDCGGGTVDITFCRVANMAPLQVAETAPPGGGPWGSTYVDREFFRAMRAVVGDRAWAALDNETQLNLLEAWEAHKVGMGAAAGAGIVADADRFSLPVGDLLDSLAEFANFTTVMFTSGVAAYNAANHLGGSAALYFDARGRRLTFPTSVVHGFFKPTLTLIVNYLTRMLRDGGVPCEHMLVAGGYAESRLLQAALRTAFEPRYNIIVPTRPGCVVNTGAALFALQMHGKAPAPGPVPSPLPLPVTSRIMRYSYSYQCSSVFSPALHHEPLSYVTAAGERRILTLSPFVLKGQSISAGTVKTEVLTPVSSTATHVTISLYRTDGLVVDTEASPATPPSVVVASAAEAGKNHAVLKTDYVASVRVLLGGEGLPTSERTVSLTIEFGGTEIIARAVSLRSGASQEVALTYERS